MLHKADRLTAAMLLLMLTLVLALTACSPESAPAAPCKTPVPVDAHVTLQPEFARFKLKLPEGFRYDLTLDCKYMRSGIADMIWLDGRLMTHKDFYKLANGKPMVHVRIILGGFVDPNKKTDGDSGYLDPSRYVVSIPHRNYPLVLYPNSQIFPEDSYSNKDVQRTHYWGIKNTVNPLTKRPFLAHCAIPEIRKSGQEYIDEDFYGESKCWSAVHAIKGDHKINAGVEVWADGGREIDRIHNAVQSLLESAIQEE